MTSFARPRVRHRAEWIVLSALAGGSALLGALCEQQFDASVGILKPRGWPLAFAASGWELLLAIGLMLAVRRLGARGRSVVLAALGVLLATAVGVGVLGGLGLGIAMALPSSGGCGAGPAMCFPDSFVIPVGLGLLLGGSIPLFWTMLAHGHALDVQASWGVVLARATAAVAFGLLTAGVLVTALGGLDLAIVFDATSDAAYELAEGLNTAKWGLVLLLPSLATVCASHLIGHGPAQPREARTNKAAPAAVDSPSSRG